jgi:hypothetical protein
MSLIFFFNGHLKFRIKSNVQIHTYEENDWNIKGKYKTALKDNDKVTWMMINGNYVLPMWLVSDILPYKSDYN